MYKFETVIGTQKEKPQEVDTTSSQYVVYIRKDIEPYQEFDGEELILDGWKYKEMVVPNNNYIIEQLKENKETNEAIMLGLADIYENQLGV